MRAGTTRYRRPRHGRFARTSRMQSFRAFLTAQATRLAASATGQTFTATPATDQLAIDAHGHVTGEGPFVVSNAGGALPTPLTVGTLYWVRSVDAGNVQLALSREDAVEGRVVDITDAGTGTHTLTRAVTARAIFELVKAGFRPRRIAAAADIDALP